MSEKVLFELRVTPDGVTVTESPDWVAYHARRGGDSWLGGLKAWIDARRKARRDTIRRQLDSLQGIYNDLYTETEAS